MEMNGHMTAAVLYGREDMKIERVDIPSLGDDEVLVKVEVALTCGTDLKVWKQGSHPRMIKPPALFGHELAGVIEEKGRKVNGGVHTGMRVVPSNSAPCNQCIYCRKSPNRFRSWTPPWSSRLPACSAACTNSARNPAIRPS
jgi:L-iditol 2-dehydrogenase